jgi:hypothetical protein
MGQTPGNFKLYLLASVDFLGLEQTVFSQNSFINILKTKITKSFQCPFD